MMFGKQKDVIDHFQAVKREAHAHSMSSGKDVMPVLLSHKLTKSERRLIKHPQTAWCKVQIEQGTRLIAYCHFDRRIEGDGEVLKTFKKGLQEKGLLLCFYRVDGSPFPNADNQLLCEIEEATPSMLEGPQGMDIAREIVCRLLQPHGVKG